MKSQAPAKHSRARRSRLTRRPTQAPGSTREEILAAARAVLLREGYERFTTRKVASTAGITVGNLTYHFPSKRQLLGSLIERLLGEYATAIEGFFANLSVPMDRKFRALIEWLMADAATLESNQLFRELWAMAIHDRFLARAVDDFYDEAIERVAQMLCQADPAISRKSAVVIAHLVAVISEGTGVIYGTRLKRSASHADVQALAVQVLTGTARDAGSGDGMKSPQLRQARRTAAS